MKAALFSLALITIPFTSWAAARDVLACVSNLAELEKDYRAVKVGLASYGDRPRSVMVTIGYQKEKPAIQVVGTKAFRSIELLDLSTLKIGLRGDKVTAEVSAVTPVQASKRIFVFSMDPNGKRDQWSSDPIEFLRSVQQLLSGSVPFVEYRDGDIVRAGAWSLYVPSFTLAY